MSWKMENYIRLHLARVFFDDPTQWKRECAVLGIASSITQAEYDRLLKGTDAGLYVPLWASACVGAGDALLNEVTLDVIRCYKKLGYRRVEMDGNPPDYIGQQCRFLEYLELCRRDDSGAGLVRARDEFIDLYFAATVRAISRALDEGGETAPELRAVLELMNDVILGRETAVPAAAAQAAPHFDSWGWSRRAELPLEPPHVTTHASFCDCGNKCKMLAEVQEGCVLSVYPDQTVPEKKFYGCARGRAYRQTFLSPHRLRYPMERCGERGSGVFRRIGWEEAAQKVAAAITRTGKLYGPGSRFVMSASGVSAMVRGDRFVKQLLSCGGGYLSYYNSYSIACASYVLPYVYGTDVCGSPEEDLLHTRLLLLWGHNPADTVWGDRYQKILTQVKAAGTRIIVIDPRRSDTARLFADQWIGLRPGTDGALADALAYVIWSRGLQAQAFMDRYCLGFDEEHMPPGVPPEECLRAYLFGERDGVVKTPEWAQEICGVPAQTITDLALAYAAAKPACLMPGLGPQRTMNGEQNCRSFAMLACLTGNVGVPGGGSGGYPSRHGHAAPELKPKESPYPGAIPTFLWTRCIDAPETMDAAAGLRGVERLESGIKLLFNLASGILLNQHSDINETMRILREPDKLETLVVSDILMTPGARFADLLLPAPSFFETENVVPPWTSADYLLYNQQAIAPLFGCRFEYDWVRQAAGYMGLASEFSAGHKSLSEWTRALYEAQRQAEPELPPFEEFKRRGCHIYRKVDRRVAFAENIDQGVPFATPSGRIEIFSERLYRMGRPADIPGIPRYTPCAEGVSDPGRRLYPLQLIGYHSKRRCHSIHDGNRLLEAIDPPALWIHPDDARARGVDSGDTVEVFNARGVVRIPARVTENIVPGCVAMSEGGWYTPDSAGRDTRGSINVLTTQRATPLANGNPQHSNLVQVRRAQPAQKD